MWFLSVFYRQKIVSIDNVIEDGLSQSWHENGQKSKKETYDNFGIKYGLSTEWYEDGQKWIEGTYKGGMLNGLYTVWYENGQRSSVTTWKNDEIISGKCWDEDGNETDCY